MINQCFLCQLPSGIWHIQKTIAASYIVTSQLHFDRPRIIITSRREEKVLDNLSYALYKEDGVVFANVCELCAVHEA